ncbi:MAG: hypothetical protein A2X67_13060 [Ignavibacteria bacterium GWA2_55_11]|nr:MAG: hypothetical protein A2X67_13060 [Ignavibacteria bacterium GWA2_55_11]
MLSAMPRALRRESVTLVDIATVPNGVHGDRVLGFQDFEDDAVRVFAEFVEPCEVAFEGKELCGIEIGRKPVKPIQDSTGSDPVAFRSLLRRI